MVQKAMISQVHLEVFLNEVDCLFPITIHPFFVSLDRFKDLVFGIEKGKFRLLADD
jgi:hypothetical protein